MNKLKFIQLIYQTRSRDRLAVESAQVQIKRAFPCHEELSQFVEDNGLEGLFSLGGGL